MELIDLTGQKFNKWTVISRANNKTVPSKQKKTHWTCKCECGTVKDVYMDSLKSGKSKSCGCNWGKPDGEAAKRQTFNLYRGGAKIRGFSFNLNEKEFIHLTSQKCFYCNSEPSNRSGGKKSNGYYHYNGLDRIDNTKGYELDNVVTCCKNCNLAKRQLTQIEFFEMIKMIYERHCK